MNKLLNTLSSKLKRKRLPKQTSHDYDMNKCRMRYRPN